MQRTITRLYDTREHALAALRDLEAAGFSHDDLGIVAAEPSPSAEMPVAHPHKESGSGGIGAALGGLAGGGAGLAAALGAIAIPGIGPLVAAGALATTLLGAGAGAVAGGLAGSLIRHGVSEEHAPVYAEGVRRGGSIVTARVNPSRAAEVEAILDRHNPVNPTLRGADYRAEGWRDDDEYREEDGRPALQQPRRPYNDPIIPGSPLGGRQL